MIYKIKRTVKILCEISLFVFVSLSVVSADTDRDIAIDRAIGGMVEGSRILPPGTYGKETMPDVQGKALSPGMDAKVMASPPAAEKNTVDSGAVGGNFPGGVNQVSGPNDTGVGETGGNIGENSGETSGGTTNPIVDVDANADLNSGNVEVDG